jgi:DNA-binding transcriptional ArsR family regulator
MQSDAVGVSVSSEPEPPSGDGRRNEFERSQIVGDLRQRRILSILLGRSRPIAVERLAARLVSEADGPAASADDRRSVALDLHHRCLPKLEAVGWIDRRPEGIVVDEPLRLGAESFSPPDLREPEHPDWDAVAVLLGDPRREAIASLVVDRRRHVAVDDLAAELRAAAPTSRGTLPADDRTLRIALHQVDLPQLATVGLVDYDRDGGTVARTDRLLGFAERRGLGAE